MCVYEVAQIQFRMTGEHTRPRVLVFASRETLYRKDVKVCDGEATFASTRAACAPRNALQLALRKRSPVAASKLSRQPPLHRCAECIHRKRLRNAALLNRKRPGEIDDSWRHRFFQELARSFLQFIPARQRIRWRSDDAT